MCGGGRRAEQRARESSPVACRPPPVVRRLPSAVCRPPSAVHINNTMTGVASAPLTPTPSPGPGDEDDCQGSSERDQPRSEEPWTAESEALLRHWASGWTRRERRHREEAWRTQRLSRLIRVPSYVIPVLTAPLTASGYIDKNGSALALAVLAMLSGLNSVFDFGKESGDHFKAATQYSELVNESEEVLCKSKRFRPECDVFVNELMIRADSASRNAPCLRADADSDEVPISSGSSSSAE